MKTLTTALCAALIATAGLASAHPHKSDETDTVVETKKTWPFFGSKTDDAKDGEDRAATGKRAIIRMKREGEGGETVDVLKFDADNLSEEFSDIARDMAAMFSEFADDIEIERGEESGTALKFDGEEMLRFKMDRSKASDDRLSITGLGRNLSVERETVMEDGKARTRIVIEMDGGNEVEIDLPEE